MPELDEKLCKAVEVLRAFGATRILLFGSYAENPGAARDIDIAAEGIPLRMLWRADSALTEAMGAPCDLVVREENPGFYALVEKRAKVLYEQAALG